MSNGGYASHKDVNALGGKVERLKVDFGTCQGRNEAIITGLQRDTQLQWEELKEVKDEIHELALAMQTMRDTVISSITKNIGLITGVVGIIIIALQVVSMVKK